MQLQKDAAPDFPIEHEIPPNSWVTHVGQGIRNYLTSFGESTSSAIFSATIWDGICCQNANNQNFFGKYDGYRIINCNIFILQYCNIVS